MALESTYRQGGGQQDYTPAAAVVAGQIVVLPDGRVGSVKADLAASELGAVYTSGIFDVACASGTTFSAGGPVWWDDSAGAAVGPVLTLDPAADVYLGRAVEAKGSGPLVVRVDLNWLPPRGEVLSIWADFDCGLGAALADVILIPAEWNPGGLLINEIIGVVTEVPVGSSEDQGVVTVSDESDNALATLTFTDAAADVIKDIIVGYQRQAASTGDAGLVVAAGEFIDAIVTTLTVGGSIAGRMKVLVKATPMPLF